MRKYIVIFIILFVFYYLFKYCNESNISGNSSKSVTFREDFATGLPSAPVVQSITRGAGLTANITLVQSSTSNLPINNYRFNLYDHVLRRFVAINTGNGGTIVSGTTRTVVISLTEGVPYWFEVYANNTSGSSPASNQMLYIHTRLTDTKPIIPSQPSVTLGNNRQATVTWTAPNNGGSIITSYRVNTYQGHILIKTNYTINYLTNLAAIPRFNTVPTSLVVTDLSSGIPHTFTVIATNAVGDSSESSKSAEVIPYTIPSAPVLSATVDNSLVNLNWNDPSNNGRDISSFIIERSITSATSGFTTNSTENKSTLSKSVSSLTNGTTYYFRVYATNLAGNGISSNAVTVIPRTIPGTPTITSVVAGNGQATVTWTAPASNGSTITSYNVISSPAGGTATINFATRTATVTSLTNDTTYTFTVTATNAAGNSPSSTSVSVRPVAGPLVAPTITSVVPGNGQATVNWNTPTNTTGITSYIIEKKTDSTDWEFDSSSTILTLKTKLVTNLLPRTLYSFRMYARNSNGDGIYSNVVTTTTLGPLTKPNTPAQPSVIVGNNNQATVSWTTPYNGGSPITGYIINTYQGTVPGTVPFKTNNSTTIPQIVTDLSNGMLHTFTVIAKNAIGDSEPSIHSTPITAITVPNVPTLSLTAGTGEAIVNWSHTITDGRPVTGYIIQRSTTNSTTSTWSDFPATNLETSKTVSGLINGITYYFRVSAINNVGNSVSSVQNVIPYTVPGAPLNLTHTPGSDFVDLSWNAPSTTGGRDISNYRIETKIASSTNWETYSSTNATTRFEKVTGLTNGITYSFKVNAINIAGDGLPTEVSAMPVGPPSVPRNVSANLQTNTQANITWDEPENIGALQITRYNVTSIPTTPISTIIGTSATASNLSPDILYTFTVTATNSANLTSVPAYVSVRTELVSIPPPTIQSATPSTLVGQVRLTWTPSTTAPSNTSYTVENIPNGASIQYPNALTPQLRREAIISGLPNTSRTFTVRATNGTIFSDAVSSQVTPTQLAAPTGINVGPGTYSDQAVVSWTAPNNTPSNLSITYNISITNQQPAATLQANGATSTTVSGLTNNSHIFTVTATSGDYTSEVSSTPFIPTSLAEPVISEVASNGTVRLTMTAPLNGSAPITSYTVTSTSVQQSQIVVTGSVATISQLTNGTNYTFNVVATNGGYTSNKNITVMPIGPPTVPRNVTATLQTNNTQANITWDEPVNIGAAGTLTYTVPSNNSATISQINETTATASNLLPGTSYTFTVKATNSANLYSEAQSNSVTPVSTTGESGAPTNIKPNKPTNVTTTHNNDRTQAIVSWTKPTSNGGTPITSYTVKSNPVNINARVIIDDSIGNNVNSILKINVIGLTPSIIYTFTVVARNILGDSLESDQSSEESSVTPTNISPPTLDSVNLITDINSLPNKASVNVNWINTSDINESILYYTINVSQNTKSIRYIISNRLKSQTVTDLSSDQSYSFNISKVTGNNSLVSSNTLTIQIPTYPITPTISNTSIQSFNESVNLLWIAQNPLISSFKIDVRLINNNRTLFKSISFNNFNTNTYPGLTIIRRPQYPTMYHYVINELENDIPYWIFIYAINQVGTSFPRVFGITPRLTPKRPLQPIIIETIPNYESVTVKWFIQHNGGNNIIEYIIRTYLLDASLFKETTFSSTITEHLINGLSTGTPYRFTITARNSINYSQESFNFPFLGIAPLTQAQITARNKSAATTALISVIAVSDNDVQNAVKEEGYSKAFSEGLNITNSTLVGDEAKNFISTMYSSEVGYESALVKTRKYINDRIQYYKNQVEPFGNVSQTRTANSRTNKLPTGVYSSNNMSIYAISNSLESNKSNAITSIQVQSNPSNAITPIQVEPFGNVSQTRTANSRTNKLPTGVYSSNNMSIYATIPRY